MLAQAGERASRSEGYNGMNGDETIDRCLCKCGVEFLANTTMVQLDPPPPAPELPWRLAVDRPCPGCGELDDLINAKTERLIEAVR